MGGSSPRFDYYSNRRKHGAFPSAHTYNSPTIATHKGGKSFLGQPNRSYSFGVSRANMKKIHVDSILDPSARRVTANPGPGEHELAFEWATPKDSLLNKTSPQFSFAKSTTIKADHFERQLRKAAVMPGPGQYGSRQDSLDLGTHLSGMSASKRSGPARFSLMDNPDAIDSTPFNQTRGSFASISVQQPLFLNTNMEKVGKSLTSTIRTDKGSAFSRANDRFRPPTFKQQSPSPQAYRIGDSIGYDDNERHSHYKTSKNNRAVFGRQNREAEYIKFLTPQETVEMPGPGQYSHYTQFNNDEKHNRSIIVGKPKEQRPPQTAQ